MERSITVARVAGLVGDFGRSPAYLGLADALRLPIADGRVPLGARLPSERDLASGLDLSRTTVTRAYENLVAGGYAEARRGAGTYSAIPDGLRRAHDLALTPLPDDTAMIDLNCAAMSAPPGVMAAYAQAVAELPAYLAGHGYFPAGAPVLQEAVAADYAERGLPTEPEQIVITSGALSAAAIVVQATLRTGQTAMVETPTYANCVQALRHAGARLIPSPVDPDGWDLDQVEVTLQQTRPRLAYLIPDFQNPTGHLMSDEQRSRYARMLRRSETLPVVDESHHALNLDGVEVPRPFAAYAPETITIGSASKSIWGGLRIGWIRMPRADDVRRLVGARVHLDLGAPVLEQIAAARLLGDGGATLRTQIERLRAQRDALVGGLGDHAPRWRFRVPSGGMCLWCELPSPHAVELAAIAETRGVIVAPGPVFAVDGGLDRFIRVPWVRPADQMIAAARVLGESWDEVTALCERGRARGEQRVVLA